MPGPGPARDSGLRTALRRPRAGRAARLRPRPGQRRVRSGDLPSSRRHSARAGACRRPDVAPRVGGDRRAAGRGAPPARPARRDHSARDAAGRARVEPCFAVGGRADPAAAACGLRRQLLAPVRPSRCARTSGSPAPTYWTASAGWSTSPCCRSTTTVHAPATASWRPFGSSRGSDSSPRERSSRWRPRTAGTSWTRVRPGSGRQVGVERPQLLDVDHDNLRAALGWALRHDPERALLLGVTLSHYWLARGHFAEGAGWLERILEVAVVPSRDRVRAIFALAILDARSGLSDRLPRAPGRGVSPSRTSWTTRPTPCPLGC